MGLVQLIVAAFFDLIYLPPTAHGYHSLPLTP